MAELKKCPFCKSENLYIIHDKKSIKRNTFVECQNCKATAPIEAWNNRATEAEIRAMAYDEFAEKLKAELRDSIIPDEQKFQYERKTQERICVQNVAFKIIIKLVEQLAEQLKEE